jgi:hypothetical protein
VPAARAIGASPFHVPTRHVLPNIAGPTNVTYPHSQAGDPIRIGAELPRLRHRSTDPELGQYTDQCAPRAGRILLDDRDISLLDLPRRGRPRLRAARICRDVGYGHRNFGMGLPDLESGQSAHRARLDALARLSVFHSSHSRATVRTGEPPTNILPTQCPNGTSFWAQFVACSGGWRQSCLRRDELEPAASWTLVGGRDRDRTCDPYHVNEGRWEEEAEMRALGESFTGVLGMTFLACSGSAVQRTKGHYVAPLRPPRPSTEGRTTTDAKTQAHRRTSRYSSGN